MISSEGENLVFLLSLPRSGSTLLSLLFSSHSAILCPPEPWFLLKLAALTQQGYVGSVFNDEMATISTKEFLQDNIFVEASNAFAITAYNSSLRTAGKTIFVDKTPRYYHILEFIDKLFPKARKIWLKRDPLDVALSYRTAWQLSAGMITGQEIIVPACFDFAVGLFNLATYFDEFSPYKLEVRYEALVQSPQETIADICRFIGVQFEKEMLNYAQNGELISRYRSSTAGDKKALASSSVHARSVGKWTKKLSLREIQQIVQLLGFNIFHRMGYSDTVDTLQALGIEACSEAEAAEARCRIYTTNVDRLHYLNLQLSQLRDSRSWKITKPLRKLSEALRTVVAAVRKATYALSNPK